MKKAIKKILKKIEEENDFFRVDWQYETVSFYSEEKRAYLFFSKFHTINLEMAREMQRRIK